jgi:WD40 repeat protein
MWNLKGGHEKQINHVAFTVDRTRVVTCSSDKTLRTFDILSTTELTKIVGHVGSVTMCDISPGETSWILHNLPRRGRTATTDTCVVASASEDCTATLYNVNTGMTIHKLSGHIKAVLQVAFTPNGQLVATASADTSVRIWDAVTGECKHTLLGHTGDINAIQFLQDNKTLLSVSNDTSCRVWDIEHGLPLALLSGHTLPVTCLDYSPGSERAITGSRDKTLRLWNLWKAAGVKTLRGHTAGVLSVAFSRNGRKIFSGGRDKCIRVWSVDDNHHKHWSPEQGYGPMMEFAQLRKKPNFPGAKALVLCTAPNDRSATALVVDCGELLL